MKLNEDPVQMSNSSEKAMPKANSLRISEIFLSIQGESSWAGNPCVFIRLTGCPLRCTWCDTEYSFSGGTQMSFEEVLSEAVSHETPLVELTGGEPLAQKNAPEFLDLLCENFETVLLETSGSFDISKLNSKVKIIMDLKAPGSGEVSRNLWANLKHLDQDKDEIKIVIADREDYLWARELLSREDWPNGICTLFSPAMGQIEFKDLAEWILEDRLAVKMQLQLHKFIWDPNARGV